MSKISSYRSLATTLWRQSASPRPQDYRLLARIRAQTAQFAKRTDSQLLDEANRIRESTSLLARNKRLASILERKTVVDCFSLATEALRRHSGKVYYDVQLLGGLALSTGTIAEMQTGEGKTITCGLAAILYGLAGEGVHVATTNAYLAQRDFEEMQPVFERLGLTAGRIESQQPAHEKQAAYQCDITYGTGYEFGFDFLRDQLAMRNRPEYPLGTRFVANLRGQNLGGPAMMQRQLAMAIIDEADSVLIDEATTPLILSGTGNPVIPDPEVYRFARTVANELAESDHYRLNPTSGAIELTDAGWDQAHHNLPDSIRSKVRRPWNQYIEQALRAELTLKRNIDYVVQDRKILFVDQNTGRVHEERKWRGGLHQAIETKENIPLTDEQEIEARISRQRYFQFYDRISGMTGTAQGNEAEMEEFYRLPIVGIPRNKPSRSIQLRSRFFASSDAKFEAIAADVRQRQQSGQPILVGTSSISQSQLLSELLTVFGVRHTVLNGTQNEEEADIISRAGISGNVTIATNMAGRGTDIRLDEAAFQAGGLHVVAAEHQESPRTDRQLTGRSARQNDPGSCQFFVSADDDIISRHDRALARQITRTARKSGESKSNYEPHVRKLQRRIEKLRFDARRKMVMYDNWLESVQESVAKLA